MVELNIKNISKLKVKELKSLVPYGIDITNKKKPELVNIIKNNLPEVVEQQRIRSLSDNEWVEFVMGALKKW